MTFLVKFTAKGISLFAIEMGEVISDVAYHIVSPAKLAYRVVAQIDFSNTEDENSTQTKAEYLLRPRYDDQTLVSKKAFIYMLINWSGNEIFEAMGSPSIEIVDVNDVWI